MFTEFDLGYQHDPNWLKMINPTSTKVETSPVEGTDLAPVEQFQHIVDKLNYLWGYPEVTIYLESLIMDTDPTRGRRQGFPPAVKSDILFLYNLYIEQFSMINRDRNATTPFDNRVSARNADVWDYSA
jgi:hypothetical protein